MLTPLDAAFGAQPGIAKENGPGVALGRSCDHMGGDIELTALLGLGLFW